MTQTVPQMLATFESELARQYSPDHRPAPKFRSTTVNRDDNSNTRSNTNMAVKTPARRTRKSTAAKPAAKSTSKTTVKKSTAKSAAKPAVKATKKPIETLPKVAVQKTVNGTFEITRLPSGTGGIRMERPVGDNNEVTYMSQDEWNRLGRPSEGTKIERRFLLA
jgi:flagellar biosynthesis/type III secretory pathway M-ring protein FliF/YscJ